MFKPLHVLAQKATLLIVVTAEDDQLRVNVTPTQVDLAGKEKALRPLSLIGTPEELDDGFAEALAVWQAPKRSLVEQAAAAAGAPDEKVKTAPKASKAKPAPTPAPAKEAKGGRGKKVTGAEPATETQSGAEASQDEEDADGDASAEAEEPAGAVNEVPLVAADDEPAAVNLPVDENDADAPPVDVFTLDLF